MFGIMLFSFQNDKKLYAASFIYSLLYVLLSDTILRSFSSLTMANDPYDFLLGICFKLLMFVFFFTSMFLFKEFGHIYALRLGIFYNKLKKKNIEYVGLLKQLTQANDERNNSIKVALDKNMELERLTEQLLHQREVLEEVLISYKKQEQELDKNYQASLEKESKIKEQYAELVIIKEEIDSQNEMILKQQQLLLVKNKALETYTKAVLYLNKTKKANSVTFNKKIKEILMTCAQILDLRYVNIWKYDANSNSISRLLEYDKKENSFTDGGGVFYGKDYPIYFKSILSNAIIKIDQIHEAPEISEFLEGYFIPKNIHSTLECPFFINGEFGGIMCIEQELMPRVWSNEEIFFSKSLTEIISNTFMELQNSEHEEKIVAQASELNKKNELLEQQKYEIENIKNYLEERIKERTMELQQKNTKLTEIAKTNSIILKKPLHRILGLCYIMQEQYSDIVEIQECLTHLKTSSKELEVAVDKINEMLSTFDSSS